MPTGIDAPQVAKGQQVAERVYYSINGARLAAPAKGINIMRQRMADGTVKTVKVLVK
ncbi:MAG: hypothetical protein IKP43_12300 [Bacteroidaceae bacterium]|nr:hypothetical protein [Bacteroidaceae bacterium]